MRFLSPWAPKAPRATAVPPYTAARVVRMAMIRTCVGVVAVVSSRASWPCSVWTAGGGRLVRSGDVSSSAICECSISLELI